MNDDSPSPEAPGPAPGPEDAEPTDDELTLTADSDADADSVAGAHQAVSFLELFFDLVWVFAVSQLSGHLVDDLTWTGAAQTAVMALAMFAIWSFSMIESTMTLARRDGAGWIILATMAGGLVMNAAIPTAFAEGAWGFVVPLVLIRIGRSLATRRYDVYEELRAHRLSMAVWALVSAVPWVIGALAAPGPRLAWWTLAVAVDLLGARLKHPVPWNHGGDFSGVRLDVDHQVERTRLFLIICFGEAIVTTGSALAEDVRDPARLLTALLSLGVVIALWTVFFGVVDVAPERVDDGGRRSDIDVANIGTSWQAVLLLAVVAFAVAAEEIVARPAEGTDWAVAACLTVGPAVCLAARSLYLGGATSTAGRGSLMVGAAVLVALGAVSAAVGLAQGLAMAGCAVVVTVIAVAHRHALA